MKYVIITNHADGCPVTVDTVEHDSGRYVKVFTEYFLDKIGADEMLDEEEIVELKDDIHNVGVEVDGHFVYHTMEGTCVMYRQS